MNVSRTEVKKILCMHPLLYANNSPVSLHFGIETVVVASNMMSSRWEWD